ncbi:hypothetical protein PN480_04625 [Dolichospermum circinale CS-1225]|uniref:Uncharacterized protein n=1 Tax=Dolichospermum circinale CS-537/01 TaxID=3021739 RepID=A0ABT5A6I7_9CYAN|nr:hypothetical protein [Dolichospermum circinale]MDB9456916.1 hypothetical protein [Dolichospermum circinale CS-545/17]MDB9454643.1 hypothetical protein [Dolichospermum circinale CS-541/06]MDB9461434.1 hypothetical protein [Dolichospermum circinale CS-541/04]MDB9466502.1 hypothetical protein [Dolichospermum circinale CS-539/09]MDB9472049.1 hypothetical protein [Dolichospermum circinale CS-539]
MNDTVWNGEENLDIDYLIKLEKAIQKLIELEESTDDELELQDARTDVKRRIKGVAIEFNINGEFINSYLINHR